MVQIVLKAEQSLDLYVIWSTGTDAPIAWGTREEALLWLSDQRRRMGPHGHTDDLCDPAGRLARADATGTSATAEFGFFGRWDRHGLIYEQRGILPRYRLARACELLEEGRDAEVWDLLEPLESEMEVRRG
jgi:hypothetical protein